MSHQFKPFQAQKTGIDKILEEAKKHEEAQKAKAEAGALQETAKPIEKVNTAPKEYVPVEQCLERISVIFDDSGSMHGEAIKDAREGCIEFLRNCTPNAVAVGILPMNDTAKPMTSNLPKLAGEIKTIQANGYTPLFPTWAKALNTNPAPTRTIIFSDGGPDSKSKMGVTIALAIEKKIPCDTVLICTGVADPTSSAYQTLKEIATSTGGIFMVFDRNKMDFKTGFKFLAPALRTQLALPGVIEAIQEGKM